MDYNHSHQRRKTHEQARYPGDGDDEETDKDEVKDRLPVVLDRNQGLIRNEKSVFYGEYDDAAMSTIGRVGF